MRVTGTGLLINLRPKEEAGPAGGAGGFNGAKTAFLKKNVHIMLHDVGPSGILPGTAKPEQRQGDRTPLDLHARGPMQIDLPKPRDPVLVGPPAPPLPTLATFVRDVIVVRGKAGQTPDQLNCDHLDLTLLPADKPPAPAQPADADATIANGVAAGDPGAAGPGSPAATPADPGAPPRAGRAAG